MVLPVEDHAALAVVQEAAEVRATLIDIRASRQLDLRVST
jgi:hypothetical protein